MEINQSARRVIDVGGVWIVGNVEEIEDEEVSDAFSEDGADQRDGFRKIRADQRDGSSKTRADHGDEFGFYSRKRTCKCQEETGETKSVSRRNRFLALTAIESDNNEEVNARWNNLMLHLSIWKQMRSTCSVAFVVRCLIRAVQLFGPKACWAQDFLCVTLVCSPFQQKCHSSHVIVW